MYSLFLKHFPFQPSPYTFSEHDAVWTESNQKHYCSSPKPPLLKLYHNSRMIRFGLPLSYRHLFCLHIRRQIDQALLRRRRLLWRRRRRRFIRIAQRAQERMVRGGQSPTSEADAAPTNAGIQQTRPSPWRPFPIGGEPHQRGESSTKTTAKWCPFGNAGIVCLQLQSIVPQSGLDGRPSALGMRQTTDVPVSPLRLLCEAQKAPGSTYACDTPEKVIGLIFVKINYNYLYLLDWIFEIIFPLNLSPHDILINKLYHYRL